MNAVSFRVYSVLSFESSKYCEHGVRMRNQTRMSLGLRGEAAFTLVEVMIATMVFAVMVFAMMSSVVFSSRTTRLNTNALAAKNVAQGYFERMTIDVFANVNPPADGFYAPPNGGYADVDYDDNPPVWLDEGLGIRCRVEFDFKGYGRVTSGSSVSIRDDRAVWESNEWVGDAVYLIDGAGTGQYAEIRSNTSNTLNFSESFRFPPNSSTRYMINNGKTVEVTTTWQYMGRDYSQTIESLIINYLNDEDLGF